MPPLPMEACSGGAFPIVRWMSVAALLLAGACGGGGATQGPPGSGGASATGGSSGATGGTTGGSGGAGGSAVNASDGPAPLDATDAPVTADGSSDGDAAGAGALILPIQRGDLAVLEFGSIAFSVKPSAGARIVSLKLDGDELLADATAHPQYYGSTLWTSPAGDWVVPGTFVPPPIVDSDPYTTTVSADGVITATSAASTANSKRFTVTKVFRADIPNRAIVVDYKITNTGTAAFRLSHWEVTRVRPDGLIFFPSETTAKIDFLAQQVKLTRAGGYTWYDNTSHMMNRGESKAGLDPPGGFIASVSANPKGDLLFMKVFKAITMAAGPPTHYPVELYCNNPHTYVELEDHSSYDQIAPGSSYTQTVRWYLRRLPVGTDRTPGSAALIAATKAVLGP